MHIALGEDAVTSDEVARLSALVAQHKWVPLAALAIALIVRLLKSDTKIPIDIPPNWRVRLAIALGCVSGVLEAVTTGTGWTESIVGGLISAALAVLGHETIINSLRGGKEFVVPGLTKPGVPPAPGKPPSIPAPALPEMREPMAPIIPANEFAPRSLDDAETTRRTPRAEIPPRKG